MAALVICGVIGLFFFAMAPYILGEAKKAGAALEAERLANDAELKLRDAELEHKASLLIVGSDEWKRKLAQLAGRNPKARGAPG